ncbi:GLPGLI family protein [Tenacibaculum finnmarkense]|uniref:GLPGLI family protein n=1 Tax=Tenacibaculum finnmarkense TaxID=2781243 RepID=UPI001E4DD97B|nr:GLPGLI family protein [Tenacibaculum finnmarkense]MCD8421327.1 GLPGLI family protein [Tenacibaculum finnmarkense genomovar ulcerans]MCG8237463.1 GLPGLI family protein [Tenacibaculum finnmarkense genomovar ulcerans]
MLEKRILILFCLMLSLACFAQKKSGIVKYKAEVNKKYVDSFLVALKKDKKTAMHIKQGVIQMFRNSTPDEFILSFKNEESYYHHIPKLKNEVGFSMGSRAGTMPYYTNNKTNAIIEISRALGATSHKSLDWKVNNKTKMIGKYKCYQATTTERLYSRKGFYYSKQAIAWFAPSIPLNFGPMHYKGLPGLILALNTDEFTMNAVEINLNPLKEVKIKRLSKKTKIKTQEEAHGLIDELEKERKKGY